VLADMLTKLGNRPTTTTNEFGDVAIMMLIQGKRSFLLPLVNDTRFCLACTRVSRLTSACISSWRTFVTLTS
jgi:hypothetical protein